VSNCLLNEGHGILERQVSCQGKGRLRRAIVGLPVAPHLRRGDLLQRLGAANNGARHRAIRPGCLLQGPRDALAGAVFGETDLPNHHWPLVLHVLLAEEWPHDKFRRYLRHQFAVLERCGTNVLRVALARKGIKVAADRFNCLTNRHAVGEGRCAAEDQMLEKV